MRTPVHAEAPLLDGIFWEKRKDYAFRRQFNEKPSVIPSCPGGFSGMLSLCTLFCAWLHDDLAVICKFADAC